MTNIFRRVFCKHKNLECITNIYGDLINDFGCRSVWRCKNCGKLIKSNKLESSCGVINFCLGADFNVDIDKTNTVELLNQEIRELKNTDE